MTDEERYDFQDFLEEAAERVLPSGSGFNGNWETEWDEEKHALVARIQYDHLNEVGYYDGEIPVEITMPVDDPRNFSVKIGDGGPETDGYLETLDEDIFSFSSYVEDTVVNILDGGNDIPPQPGDIQTPHKEFLAEKAKEFGIPTPKYDQRMGKRQALHQAVSELASMAEGTKGRHNLSLPEEFAKAYVASFQKNAGQSVYTTYRGASFRDACESLILSRKYTEKEIESVVMRYTPENKIGTFIPGSLERLQQSIINRQKTK